MNVRMMKMGAIVAVLSLLAGLVIGGYVAHGLIDDERSEDDTGGTDEASIECEACQDTKEILIIVTEGGVPAVRSYPCPFCEAVS